MFRIQSNIKNRINIRTRHLAPIILAGYNALSMLVLYLILATPALEVLETRPGLVILFFTVVALLGSFFLIRWIIQPVERFVERVRQNPVLPENVFDELSASSDVQHYERILQKITDFLDKKEAMALFPDILGQSRIMLGLMSRILKVAPTDSTVLITGESGTGKELVANALVEHSTRGDKPFIKVNCAAIPEGLLETELFGHEKGAFTGAVSSRQGKFEMAHKGTIFLDEIGDMPLPVQAKLLRVIQEQEFERVGGSKPVRVDLRIIAATNKNLEEMVEQGSFREDLYYRINVFRLEVPPLRLRREDVPLLADHFAESSHSPKKITGEARSVLQEYAWPGNVRELKNIIHSACLVSGNGLIRAEDLEIDSGNNRQVSKSSSPGPVSDLDRWLADAEKSIIISALKDSGGVQARAAEALNIKQRSLWHRLKKYSIDAGEFKQ